MTQGEELARMLTGAVRHRNIQELWADWVGMVGNCINMLTNGDGEAARMFKAITEKYSTEEVAKLDKAFEAYVAMLEDNPWQDLLGDTYMHLDMGNGHIGQFFTPYHLARLCAMPLAETAEEQIARNGYATVTDPACGGGALLIAMAEMMHKRGVEYQRKMIFVGQDLNATTAMMCYIQLALTGCPGWVVIGDTLRAPAVGSGMMAPEGAMRTPMYQSGHWQELRMAEIMRDAERARRNAE